MTRIFIACFLLFSISINAQTNVRAWYADGQVWVVWNIQLPLPETVRVFASSQPFTNINDATQIGRPFHLDYLPTALKEQVDTSATWRIPDGNGGKYQLGPTEGLFVYTPHQEGSMYFAVLADGDEVVIPGVNITDEIVLFSYDPINDPVECHLQASFLSPFSSEYFCFAYSMWADGRDNQWENRPDFPVMANEAKNGMPGFFMISVPMGLDTSKPFALTVWLHGGGGIARQSLAGSRSVVNIDPQDGILLAHNDDVFGKRGTTPAFIENPSLHFGWRKNWDPFTSDNLPLTPDTIINYTQRRYLWTDQWLIRKFNVDPARIHIQGHSMGSWGATGMAKVYPEHYASVILFNNGFRAHEPGSNIAAMFGETSAHFPTNLKNRKGETVHYPEPFDITSNTSSERDLPFLRSFHSKNDVGNANFWGEDVVVEYHAADSAGHGMALYWSERGHGIDTGPDFDDHWVNGTTSATQTAVDDVVWGETHYRSDHSYPAFYNHRLDPNAYDPGDGTPGTTPFGNGDDWGTWGGWHRWDVSSIIDEEDTWSVEAWLESNAVFDHDNSPNEQLTADLAIRRPQFFKPANGNMISWKVEDVSTGVELQGGQVIVGDDDLVSIPGIVLYKEATRRVRIIIESGKTSIEEFSAIGNSVQVFPNPARGEMTIAFDDAKNGLHTIRILTPEGKLIRESTIFLEEGENEIKLDLNESIFPGLYLILITDVERNSEVERFIKMN